MLYYTCSLSSNTGTTPRRYRTLFGWLAKFVEFEASAMICLGTIVPLMDIRIPPFPGYFFCRLMYHTWSEDPCCLAESDDDDCDFSLSYITIALLIRFVSGTTTAVFLSAAWGGIQMIIYEVSLSLIFFKACLLRTNELVMNTNITRFNGIWLKYRELQLLIQVFNSIYQIGVFAVYVGSTIVLTISSGSFMLSIYRDSIPLFLFTAGITLACYVVLGSFLTFASHIWTISNIIQHSWKQNPRLMKNPISRRKRLCVRNMKIKIGSVNFIERITPLVILAFCTEQTVTVALLSNNV
jgi:hypothetical protein